MQRNELELVVWCNGSYKTNIHDDIDMSYCFQYTK